MSDAILMSGGIDSIAVAAWFKPAVAITVNYGQLPAVGEIRAASQVANELGMEHHIIEVDCRKLGSGDLAGTRASDLAPESEWWPFRNQLLITLGVMKAIQCKAQRLLVGSIKSDGFHVDGSQPFVCAIDALCAMQEGNLRVLAPAIELTSAELVRKSQVEREILSWAHSCHTNSWACGLCRGCCKHRLVMKELGYGEY